VSYSAKRQTNTGQNITPPLINLWQR